MLAISDRFTVKALIPRDDTMNERFLRALQHRHCEIVFAGGNRVVSCRRLWHQRTCAFYIVLYALILQLVGWTQQRETMNE